MKSFIGFAALLFATGAFAQTSPPKVGNKPLVQVKPQAPFGCKQVGTVNGQSKGKKSGYRALVTDVNLLGRLDGWEVAKRARETDPTFLSLHDRRRAAED